MSYIDFNTIVPNILTCSFHYSFIHWTPHTIHRLCMSQFPTPCCFPMLFFTIKQNHYSTHFCIQRKPKSLCSLTTVALQCADSVQVPHAECSRWLHDPSHAVQTLNNLRTISSCAVHPFTEIHTLTLVLLPTFTSHSISDTHHCTQRMLFQGP